MNYDHSLKPEMIKRKKPFNNENKSYFFSEETNSVVVVGIKPKPPEKEILSLDTRFNLLDDEIYTLKSHFTDELDKIKQFAEEFDCDSQILYDYFYKLNEIILEKYFTYINDDRLFNSIQDLNNTMRNKIEKETKMMKKLYQMQMRFQKLQERIKIYLDKIEKNLVIRVEFLMYYLRQILETHDLDNIYVFNEEKFIQIRKKILDEIRKEKEIIYDKDKKFEEYKSQRFFEDLVLNFDF